MAVVIGVLRVDLEANTISFTEGMDKMQHVAAKTAGDVKRSLEIVSAAALSIGAAIAASAFEIVKHSTETIESLAHMSEAAGTTVEQLSAMAYAAKLVDLPTESLVKGMEKLASAAFKAQNGNVALLDIFKKLGVEPAVGGHLKDTGKLLDELAPKFAKMADGAGKTALARALFGKAGAEMIPFMNKWGVEMEELTASARKFGLVIGSDAAAGTLKFAEKMKDLKAAWTGFGLQMTTSAMPALTQFTDQLAQIAVKADIPKLAAQFGGWLTEALHTAGNAIDFVVQHAHALKLVFEGLIALRIANIVIPLIASISSAKTILAGIGKFAEGALGVGRLVKTLEGMGPAFTKLSGWIATQVFMMRSLVVEEGIASAATYAFSGALSVLEKHPVIIALTAIGTAMYAFRDATFTANGELYKFIDAYTALWQILSFQNKTGENTFSQVLARVKNERLDAAYFATRKDQGPELDVLHTRKPPKDDVDTRLPQKADLFKEEIKKMDLALVTAARYISLLDATPEKIDAVTASMKAEAIILELDKKLWNEKHIHLTQAEKDQIRLKSAEEVTLLGTQKYGDELKSQRISAELSTLQAVNLAKAHLQGDEAVRQAILVNEELSATYAKSADSIKGTTKELKELAAAQQAKSLVDIVVDAAKQVQGYQQQARGLAILTAGATQFTDAMREAEFAAKTLALTERINSMKGTTEAEISAKNALIQQRDETRKLTEAEWELEDAKAAVALRSPITQYMAEIESLKRAAVALEKNQKGSLDYGQTLVLMGLAQDKFNKYTDETVKLLLRFGTAKDGVKAFFMDMQKSAITTGQIIYEALHSAFDKLSEELTNLVTGAKTNFAKMLQDIGHQMVKSTIQKGLQTALGKIGEKFGIVPKLDGQTESTAPWVRLAGMAGLSIPATTPAGAATSGVSNSLGSILGAMGRGPGVLSTVFSTLGSLVGAFAGKFGGGKGLTPSVTSSISFDGPRAEGGSVNPSSAYLVGERGPEILMGASGHIASNSASQRMLGSQAPNHFYTIDARGTDPVLTEQRTRAAIIAAHNSAISNSLQVNQEHLKRMPQTQGR